MRGLLAFAPRFYNLLATNQQVWWRQSSGYCVSQTRWDGWPMAKPKKANLIFEDGSRFEGYSFGAETSTAGEIVFNTGLVGYPETLTDPSYRGQILTLTYPIVGNYGVPDTAKRDEIGLMKYVESEKIHVSGLVVQDYSHHHSHWTSVKSLSEWLKEENIPALYGIDTRMLTKRIRDQGTVLGKIEFVDQPIDFTNPNLRNLIAEVSTKEVKIYGEGNPYRVVAVDCGIKHNIIRNLVKRGAEVRLVPWDYDFTQDDYDGLFVSNGPGDPSMCQDTIDYLQKAMFDGRRRPCFGICMGNQLVGRAAGATTYKLALGNRGHNQPVINQLSGQAFVTSQNHGYAIDHHSLPSDWLPLFVNANDGTNEGIMHKTLPIFTAQFHPEACGGPTDAEFLFDNFIDFIKNGYSPPSETMAQRKCSTPRFAVSKVLVLGSGGLSIGQAGEFDYSGSQAVKALKKKKVPTATLR